MTALVAIVLGLAAAAAFIVRLMMAGETLRALLREQPGYHSDATGDEWWTDACGRHWPLGDDGRPLIEDGTAGPLHGVTGERSVQ